MTEPIQKKYIPPHKREQNSQVIRHKYAMRLVPYIIEDGNISILVGLSHPWKEWTAIGGTCRGHYITKNNEIIESHQIEDQNQCLNREIFEESKQLITTYFDYQHCKRYQYTETIHPYNTKMSWDIHNIVCYVQWTELPHIRENMISRFNDPLYEKQLIEKLKAQGASENRIKSHLELSQLKIINIRGDQFKTYFQNSIKNYHIYNKKCQDSRLSTYLSNNIGELIPAINNEDNPDDEIDQGNRFDIRFIIGLISGLNNKFGIKIKTIEDVQEHLSTFLEEFPMPPHWEMELGGTQLPP